MLRLTTVRTNLLFYYRKRTSSPLIGRLDIIVGIGVPSFVRRIEFIELMKDQENGLELACVGHERIERLVRVMLAVTEGIVGTIWKLVRIRAPPSALPRCGEGSGEVVNAASNFVVRGIVRTKCERARGIEAVHPTPECKLRIDFHRPLGAALVCP